MARKKKKIVKEDENIIKELDGFKLNDEVWARYFGGRIIQGKIDRLINTELDGKIACIITASDGYRTVLLSSCSHSIIKKTRTNRK